MSSLNSLFFRGVSAIYLVGVELCRAPCRRIITSNLYVRTWAGLEDRSRIARRLPYQLILTDWAAPEKGRLKQQDLFWSSQNSCSFKISRPSFSVAVLSKVEFARSSPARQSLYGRPLSLPPRGSCSRRRIPLKINCALEGSGCSSLSEVRWWDHRHSLVGP